jgi:FkbM family methyltransferase
LPILTPSFASTCTPWTPSVEAVFFRHYRPVAGDVILDVGAGVGEETLAFSRAVGPSGRVISVEAHPRTFRCLEKLVQYNCLRNVTPIHSTITEPACRLTNIEDSRHYLKNRSDRGVGVPVPATTLDKLIQKLGLSRIHFLKMNIEGAERLAIHGVTKTLRQTGTLLSRLSG